MVGCVAQSKWSFMSSILNTIHKTGGGQYAGYEAALKLKTKIYQLNYIQMYKEGYQNQKAVEFRQYRTLLISYHNL